MKSSHPKVKLPPAVLKFFKEQGAIGGKKGGSLGGKKAAQNMTAAERRERSAKGAAARELRRNRQK